jgi:hypothetical protein
VTAIGILSICIGSLSLLGNCVWGTESAIFYAMSMSGGTLGPVMRVHAGGPATQSSSATQPSRLTAPQVRAVLARVDALAGNGMNSHQQDALRGVLQSPGQQIIAPGASTAWAVSQVTAANVDGQGSIDLWTRTANVTLDPSGAISTVVTSVNGPNVVTSSSFRSGNPFPFQSSSFLPVIISSFLGILLAAYLLTIGILTLRGSPRGGRLHWIYAWLKIALAICGGISIVVAFNAVTGAAPSNIFLAPAIIGGIFSAAIGVIYPIGLLIALRSRTLRAYYERQ